MVRSIGHKFLAIYGSSEVVLNIRSFVRSRGHDVERGDPTVCNNNNNNKAFNLK
jgi:hypothetical protein